MTTRNSDIEKLAKVPEGETPATRVVELRRKAKACVDSQPDLALLYMDAAEKCQKDHGILVADSPQSA